MQLFFVIFASLARLSKSVMPREASPCLVAFIRVCCVSRARSFIVSKQYSVPPDMTGLYH